MANIVATCATEGGHYRLGADATAPIRIYDDGRVEDDFYTAITGEEIREVLSTNSLAATLAIAGAAHMSDNADGRA